jgi:hypothetical protein
MDQVVYREEVLTIMGLLGDVREELQRIRRALSNDDGEEEEETES